MLKIALCDDKRLHAEYAAKLIREQLCETGCGIKIYSSAEELLSVCRSEGVFPDVAFLDIEMPGADGLELAEKLNRIAPECIIIFLSAHKGYMSSAYYTEHIWYICKNEIEMHLKPALEKALRVYERRHTDAEYISVIKRGTLTKLHVDEVCLMERQRNKTRIVTAEGELDTVSQPEKLIEGLESHFVRCHQSYWVNLSSIRSRDRNGFVLSNGSFVPLSRTYKAEASKRFFEYLHP